MILKQFVRTWIYNPLTMQNDESLHQVILFPPKCVPKVTQSEPFAMYLERQGIRAVGYQIGLVWSQIEYMLY